MASLWTLCRDVLENIKQDKNVNKLNLHSLNIVQFGGDTHSKTTRKYYPEELRKSASVDDLVKEDFFVDNKFEELFKAVSSNGDLEAYLAEMAVPLLQMKAPFMTFVFTLTDVICNGFYEAKEEIMATEVAYNYRVIWKILDASVKSNFATNFEVGEIKLKAISEEHIICKNDSNHYYNADGIIKTMVDKYLCEIAILETTGPYGQKNDRKETQDYTKAGYGLIFMIHQIGRQYSCADWELFKKQRVYFIQITPTKMRVWRLGMVDKELYAMEKCGGVDVERMSISKEILIKKVANLFWKLKEEIETARRNLEVLKKSHEQNFVQKFGEGEEIVEISFYFKNNTLSNYLTCI